MNQDAPARPLRLCGLLALAGVGLVAAACGTPTAPPQAARPAGQAASACSPSVVIDGFSDALDKTRFGGTFVGNLSGLAMDTDGRILALSDRSALFTLDPRTKQPVSVVRLADEAGRPLDSEAVAVDRDGSRLVTSEVEPSVRRYSRDGKLIGRLPVPDALRVSPAGRATTNLTFEGLALQPGGGTLIASMEGPLRDDRADLVRFQTWSRVGTGDFHLAAQYGYRIDPLLGVSEITPAGDGRLLVLERGFVPGFGNTVRLYLADLADASDVGGIAELTGQPGVRLIRTTLLADLGQCPSLGATNKEPQTNPLLDNIEGMTVTAHNPAGGLQLLLVSDDNQSGTQITRLYSLTVTLPKT
jgi:hypothetical protein